MSQTQWLYIPYIVTGHLVTCNMVKDIKVNTDVTSTHTIVSDDIVAYATHIDRYYSEIYHIER